METIYFMFTIALAVLSGILISIGNSWRGGVQIKWMTIAAVSGLCVFISLLTERYCANRLGRGEFEIIPDHQHINEWDDGTKDTLNVSFKFERVKD